MSNRPTALAPRPTERQQRSLDEIQAELREKWNLNTHFDLTFEDEVRPGRGHSLRWVACDGDRIAQGAMDVYGGGDYGVGQVEWTHWPEDCECAVCEATP